MRLSRGGRRPGRDSTVDVAPARRAHFPSWPILETEREPVTRWVHPFSRIGPPLARQIVYYTSSYHQSNTAMQRSYALARRGKWFNLVW